MPCAANRIPGAAAISLALFFSGCLRDPGSVEYRVSLVQSSPIRYSVNYYSDDGISHTIDSLRSMTWEAVSLIEYGDHAQVGITVDSGSAIFELAIYIDGKIRAYGKVEPPLLSG